MLARELAQEQVDDRENRVGTCMTADEKVLETSRPSLGPPIHWVRRNLAELSVHVSPCQRGVVVIYE